MTKQVLVRMPEKMYQTLLYEADGEARNVPDVIRKKVEESYLGLADARAIRAQQKLIVGLLKRLMIDDAPVVTRILGMVDGYTEDKKKEERARLERVLAERWEAIEKLVRESEFP